MEEDGSHKDRRRFPRLSSQVYYRIGKSQSLRQRVSNISLGGVYIKTNSPLDKGTRFTLKLYLPGEKKELEIQ